MSRRRVLGSLGVAGSWAVAGCAGEGATAPADADVVAGPDGRLVFEPETLTVSAGSTVRWYFDSPGHNVSARPAHSPEVRLPARGEAFASYDPDGGRWATEARGSTFAHRLEVPGEYVYVCTPHVAEGMVGRIVVEARSRDDVSRSVRP